MSALEQIQSKQKSQHSSGSFEALAIQVQSYDLNSEPHTIVGYVINEEGTPDQSRLVRIGMRPDNRDLKGDYSRKEIADYANQHDKSHVQQGGILLFNYVWAGRETDTYSAGWAEPVAHFPDQAMLRKAMVSISFRNDGPTRFFNVRYHKPQESVSAENLDALKRAVVHALTPPLPHMHMVTGIRLVSQDGKTYALEANTQWIEQAGREYKVPAAPVDSAKVFFESENGQLVAQAFQNNEIAFAEAIPGARIKAVAATLKNLLKRPKRLEFMRNMYRPNNEWVYRNTFIGARTHPEGQNVYLTNLQEVSNVAPGYQLKDMPTPHFQPQPDAQIPMPSTKGSQPGMSQTAGTMAPSAPSTPAMTGSSEPQSSVPSPATPSPEPANVQPKPVGTVSTPPEQTAPPPEPPAAVEQAIDASWPGDPPAMDEPPVSTALDNHPAEQNEMEQVMLDDDDMADLEKHQNPRP